MSFSGVEIGDLDIYLPGPQLARHLRERGDHALGEMAVPLRPSGFLGIREVDRIDYVAALPAVVRWWVALGQRRGAWVGVLDPAAANGHRRDTERHVSLRLSPRCRR